MSGLPREVLKWIQSLDLSYSVKNVRRDFSNGFLIAEIFSRYHRSEFTMHSYVNGSSLASKKNNWEQIQHCWSKLGIEVITPIEVDGIIFAERDAAKNLVCKIYSILTNREIPKIPEVNVTGVIPPYAKPTTSNLIGTTLKDVKENEADMRRTASIAQDIINSQNKSIKIEKLENPERFRRAPKNVSRVPTRQVGVDDNSHTQFNFVKEVNIKEVENPSQHLSQPSRLSMQPTTSLGETVSQTHGSEAMMSPDNANSFSRHTAVASIDEIIESHYRQLFPEQELTFEEIAALDPSLIGDALRSISDDEVDQLVIACLQSPREFYRFSSLCFKVVGAETALEIAIESAADILSTLGAKLLQTSRHCTLESFIDFSLPRWTQILIHQPAKRTTLCRIFSGFNIAEGQSHIESLRRLKEHIPEIEHLVPCLAILATYELDLQDDIFQLYRYHCMCALSHHKSFIRVGGLAILTELLHCSSGLELVWECFDQIVESLQGEWEEQAQGIIAMATLLKRIDDQHENINDVYNVVLAQLSESEGDVRQMGLWHFGSALRRHPALLRSFVDALFQSTDQERDLLLCNGEIDIPSSLFGYYHLTCPSPEWDSLALWRGVADVVETECLENMTREHVNLLFVALNLLGEFPQEEASSWIDVFDRLKSYLLVELCDELHVEGVVQTLLKFCHDPSLSNRIRRILFGGDVPCFFGILNLLIPTGPIRCQELVSHMLEDLSSIQSFSSSVSNLLLYFNDHEPIKFQQTGFQQLLAELEH